MRCTHVVFVISVISSLLTDVRFARGESGVQVTRDGQHNLISKDVGDERWAITYDVQGGTVTGNVFRNDGGEPAFVSCDRVSTSNGEVTLRCFGADRCQAAPCSASEWRFISDATLPIQFFHPPGALATPGPIATATPKPAPTSTPQADSLAALIGTWNFDFTIISTFTDTYRLQRIDTSTGTRVLRGLDQFGGLVLAARFADLVPGSPSPFEFALLDPGVGICDFHVFNRTGATTVSGQTYIVFTDSGGRCDSSSLGKGYAMSGVRISTAAAVPMQAAASGNLDAARAARAAAVQVEIGATAAAFAPAAPAELSDLVRVLDELQR
jgi:hypothetical protein